MTARKQLSIEKRFWTAPRIVLTVVALSLIAVTGISSCTSGDQKTEAPAGNTSQPANTRQSSVPVNNATPVRSAPSAPVAVAADSLPPSVREASLRTVNGQTIKLSDYAGKVMLVNLWATWCNPCRAETPELVKLHKEFQSRGVEMVGLTTEDPEATAEAVRNFVRDFQVDYHVGWATRDVAIGLMQLGQSTSIPQSFIISREGRVLNHFVGFNPVYTAPRLRQALEDALNYRG